MGGWGSGKGSRQKAWRSKKLKTSRLPGLNVPKLIKEHKATPNSVFTFQDIKLAVSDTAIYLEGTDSQKILNDTIKVAKVPCNYGGFRYFALCPICQKRVRTLYLCNTLFACRHCLRMGYSSQNETLSYRLLQKRDALAKKINNDERTKPKWMRKKTFDRLRRKYLDLDEKEQIADILSLRTIRAVDKIFDEYGCAMTAMEILGHQSGALLGKYQ